jgi:hypothetical protein
MLPIRKKGLYTGLPGPSMSIREKMSELGKIGTKIREFRKNNILIKK